MKACRYKLFFHSTLPQAGRSLNMFLCLAGNSLVTICLIFLRYSEVMFIRSTKPAYTPPRPTPKTVVKSEEEVRPPFKERVVTHAIVGASLGAIAGERVGTLTAMGAMSYAGWTIGEMTGYGSLGGLVGGVVGSGAGFLLESKFPIGKTIGGAVGFVSGGLVGGVSGSVVGGLSAIPDLFS